MKTQIAVISAIVGTMILGRGIWQYIHENETTNRERQPGLTREQLERQTRIRQYLQQQRARELRARLQEEQERRLTQRLRRLHNSTIRI